MEPATGKRLQQADAIDVQPVERRMGEAGSERQDPEPAEMDRQPSCRPLAALRLPAVEAIEQSRQKNRQSDPGERPMRKTAPHGEALHSVDGAGSVYVRQVRADDQRRHGKAGAPLEPGLSHQRADQAVGQIVHSSARWCSDQIGSAAVPSTVQVCPFASSLARLATLPSLARRRSSATAASKVGRGSS